jgi:hypothetical protein
MRSVVLRGFVFAGVLLTVFAVARSVTAHEGSSSLSAVDAGSACMNDDRD